ncbi:MAG: TonB C-terminal domain-containing protein [Verrucomicrobiae bacterium]|nr:TonB C-terminal domain-containing protein [Verrucomicrobiae bacterium]
MTTPPKANPTPTPPKTEPPAKSTAKTTTPAPPAKNPRINTTLTTRKSSDKAATEKTTSSPTAKTGAAQSAQRAQAVERVMQSLHQGLTSGGLTLSDVVGSGVGGGPAAINYSQAVLGAYDDAWQPPPELEEDTAVTVARIIVHRTGRIVDARIIKRSGNHLMDLSVQNALEAVKELPPFPEGARDLERTFKIEFNLKVKRGIG